MFLGLFVLFVAAFLASAETGSMTAQILIVDGGRLDYIGHARLTMLRGNSALTCGRRGPLLAPPAPGCQPRLITA